MLNLEQKKLKKKILDNLVIRIGDIIKTGQTDSTTNKEVFGVYFGHVYVDFNSKKITIDYHATDKDKATYTPPKELLAGTHIFEVNCTEVPKDKLPELYKLRYSRDN